MDNTMKATNNSNYRKKVEGVWFEPGETKKDLDISEDKFSYHFKLEDETTSETEDSVQEKQVDDGNVDEDDEEESSKSEEKNNENKGD